MKAKQSILRKIMMMSALCLFVFGFGSITKADENIKIVKGVTVGTTDIGGLTVEEANAKVQEYMQSFTGKIAHLNVEGHSVDVTIGDLGYYWKNTDVLEKAKDLCRTGNVIQRYKDEKDVETTGVKYDIELDVDNTAMRESLDKYCSQYNVPHKNASLVRSGGTFTYTEEAKGRIIDMDKTIDQIHDYLLNKWDGNDTNIDITVIDDNPTASVADCQKVKDVLGTFTTKFTTNSSNYNRNSNIENGSRLINGTVIYPGETFSANEKLEPWTESNGWRAAGTYVNGKTEDSLGGGICQVSTTLYNAVLKSELEIVQRFCHSMSVGYVPLSQDAALAGTWKDLKFSNNTDAPIYIESFCSGGSITFNVYGHETRDPGRTVEFVSQTLSTVNPSESVTEDASQPVGYRKVTSSGHVGYTAQLLKRVYMNGTMISEEVINKSSYEASPITVVVGTGGQPQESQPQESQPGETQPGETQPQESQSQETQPQETQPQETTTAKEKETTEKKTEEPTEKPQKETQNNQE